MNETSTVWEWFERPENSMRRNRFTEAMRGATAHYPPELYTSAIDWDSLESGAMVVDVGGGVGNVTWILAQEFSHLLYVVQDMDKVIPEANKFWRATSPESISSGQIEIQAHDFLKPQPIKDAAVYFMRFIIHDWHDVEAIKIMKNLRDAAGPSSQLILFDIVLPNACRRKSSEHTLIGSGKRKSTSMSPPVSMLPPGIDWATSVDMQMLNLFNAQERTLEEFVALGKASRWKFQVMKPGKPLSAIIFSPA
ncbi:hypothetical protein H0H81_004293 [Sphagnurus paluster]|uniref:O-methyltransferase C-terminal domain-containing protein n=1 Tax=Sphagnurus paluster TaxID=117069 RepID=A0A9P7GPC7_9AGAR|nr:hypothetical protein H0H81_004293 [Sphagnurus paluster]